MIPMTTTEKTQGTKVSASREFASIMADLAKDAGEKVETLIDRHYLPDAKRRHEKMLRRKLAAHEPAKA